MGQVIQIKDVTRVAAGGPGQQFIDNAYERLALASGFVARKDQKDLSTAVCDAMLAGVPLTAEAPTGTGKTIAYLIGAIAASQKMQGPNGGHPTVVVATATVGLQSQIMVGDLPKLYKAGVIQEGSAVMAKGRSRYFCIHSAERMAEGGEGTTQEDFFDASANEESLALADVSTMLGKWRDNSWAGDIDSYPGKPPSAWSSVAANSATCIGHKCEHYNSCSFFSSRRTMANASIIVANHDLVLADLAMAQEGIDPLFGAPKYLLVFDEAHHLPEKAMDAGSANFQIEDTALELAKMHGFNKAWERHVDIVKLFDKAKLFASDFDPSSTLNALTALRLEAEKIVMGEGEEQYRFEGGHLHEALLKAVNMASNHTEALNNALRDAMQALKQTNVPEKSPALKPVINELLALIASATSWLSKLKKGLYLLISEKRHVRWMERKPSGTSLHSCPLEGADVLRDILWKSERTVPVMVSATLQDLTGFDRFKDRCGAPDTTREMALDHIFPYQNSVLYHVLMDHTPAQLQKTKFLKELAETLPLHVRADEGTLVLCNSVEQLRLVVPALTKRFPGRVLQQKDMGIKEVVAQHKERVDNRGGNILCGLATLAEGLDLPGHYCTHVIICAIPFTTPTTPLERERKEVMGAEYFDTCMVPDALVKLIQMVGRLMRRESDVGRITVFDRRLLTKRYGPLMMAALPRFTRRHVKKDQPAGPHAGTSAPPALLKAS
jgi:ATP-dependent DNA helicase DinG